MYSPLISNLLRNCYDSASLLCYLDRTKKIWRVIKHFHAEKHQIFFIVCTLYVKHNCSGEEQGLSPSVQTSCDKVTISGDQSTGTCNRLILCFFMFCFVFLCSHEMYQYDLFSWHLPGTFACIRPYIPSGISAGIFLL